MIFVFALTLFFKAYFVSNMAHTKINLNHAVRLTGWICGWTDELESCGDLISFSLQSFSEIQDT